jgi:hypothetical protein
LQYLPSTEGIERSKNEGALDYLVVQKRSIQELEGFGGGLPDAGSV